MILAVDQSSHRAGLALVDGNTVCVQKTWMSARRGVDQLLNCWRALFKEARIDPMRIGLVAIGLGPGNYTGLRTSLAAARLWALPGSVPVLGAGSSLALALAACEKVSPVDAGLPVMVAGDARRDSVWIVSYPSPVGVASVEQPPVIVSRSQWLRQASAAVWVSAEWQKMGSAADIARLPGTVIDGFDGVPPAPLARIAAYRYLRKLPSPPLIPVYMRNWNAGQA